MYCFLTATQRFRIEGSPPSLWILFTAHSACKHTVTRYLLSIYHLEFSSWHRSVISFPFTTWVTWKVFRGIPSKRFSEIYNFLWLSVVWFSPKMCLFNYSLFIHLIIMNPVRCILTLVWRLLWFPVLIAPWNISVYTLSVFLKEIESMGTT